jgi:hypothetical protein
VGGCLGCGGEEGNEDGSSALHGCLIARMVEGLLF